MMIFLPIYSYLDCIPTFHFEDCGSFFWYLSHHYLASSGRVDYRPWRHCLGVILPLMWCGKVSCKAFNAEVVDAWSGSFLSLLPVHHHGPPRPFKLNFYGPLPVSQGAVIPCTPRTGQNLNLSNSFSSFWIWEKKKIVISTIFSPQILRGRLLLVVMSRQKSNLSCEFKFEPITTYHIWFVVKML